MNEDIFLTLAKRAEINETTLIRFDFISGPSLLKNWLTKAHVKKVIKKYDKCDKYDKFDKNAFLIE